METISYGKVLDDFISRIEALLNFDYSISKHAVSIFLLQDDSEIINIVSQKEAQWPKIQAIISEAKLKYPYSLSYLFAVERQNYINKVVKKVKKINPKPQNRLFIMFDWLTTNPFTGIPLLLFILYWGLYKFVGVFGAGTLVNFIEDKIFINHINPWVTNLFIHIFPWKTIQGLFVGEYGIITLGIRYAIALILPIVTTFFFAFAILEDSGYLPRLALLIDRVFKKIGLSGRAVIPLVLGFGCDTMATMVTRTLPTKRERIIATLLLALAIPCSAQMGVILALLEGSPRAMFVWIATIILVFLIVGFLAKKILPGTPPSFYMEIPPIRFPLISNVFIKTYSRIKWYIKEVIPLFAYASFFIWLGKLIGIFNIFVKILEYPVKWIGLPKEASVAFLFGFFRRDYGAAGLYDLKKLGFLSANQLAISCITLTLFLPCIAQLLMNIKERGWRLGLGISLFVLLFSFSVGYLVNFIFTVFTISL
ncbi:MAG: ferrous iron transporter B [Candidatus Omnitrophota bacterium]